MIQNHTYMKATFVLVIALSVLACVGGSLGATATPVPTNTPVPVEPTATEAAAVTPTATVTEVTATTSAFDAFLLTKAAHTPIPRFEVDVPASACWMNSEVKVVTGQNVTISASGTVNTYDGKEGSNSSPDGQTAICGAIQCPKQGVGYGALVGRLEDLDTFFVGTSYSFTATKDGQLYFTVNDWECDDNSGTFNLTISIE